MAWGMRRGAPPNPAPVVDTSRTISIMGAVGAGKTVLSRTLNVAADQLRREYPEASVAVTYRPVGNNPSVINEFRTGTSQLQTRGVLPDSTKVVDQSITFSIAGKVPAKLLDGTPTRDDWAIVKLNVEVPDVPGEAYGTVPGAGYENVPALLARSTGIMLLYDPIRFLRRQGEPNRSYIDRPLGEILHHAATDAELKLAHRVAICCTKIDDPRVFELARELDIDFRRSPWFDRGAGRTPSAAMRTFLQRIGLDAFVEATDNYFSRERSRVFFSSAVGLLRAGEDTAPHEWPRDYGNVVLTYGGPRLRSQPRPFNILEPLLWLCGTPPA